MLTQVTHGEKAFMYDNYSFNKNAHIETRRDQRGNIRTETTRRDDTMSVAVSTNPETGATRFFVDADGEPLLQLTGAEARTVYRVLQKHFQNAGKSW